MALANKHTFTIADKTNPLTGKPFGDKYVGAFTIRRPSIADKQTAAIRKAAVFCAYGYIAEEMIPVGLRLIIHVFTFVTTVACENTPTWFNPENLFDDDDEAAMQAVSQEVNRWLDTFRPQRDPAPGGGGSE